MNKIEQAVIALDGDPANAKSGTRVPISQTVLSLYDGAYVWAHPQSAAGEGYLGYVVVCTYDQFMEARKRLENKPKWPDIPDWVEWIAQDGYSGKWWGYEARPWLSVGDSWNQYDDERYEPLSQGRVFGDWRNTLERRPESKPIQSSDGVDTWPQYEVKAYDGDDAVYSFRGVLGHDDTKPAEWQPGVDLPPVGEKVVIKNPGYPDELFDRFIGKEAEIIAHDTVSHYRVAVFKSRVSDGNYRYHAMVADCFDRPKAHRDKVIEALEGRITSFQGVSMRQSTSRELAEWLADIGLKLPEGEE